MARNKTMVTQGRAEFKATPFSRPVWTYGAWQSRETEPYAVSTLARDILARDDATEVTEAFLEALPGFTGYRDRKPSRVFLISDKSSYAIWYALTDAN